MNTNTIEPLNGSVNVTIHKNYLLSDDSTFAKVQRNTAGVDNLIAAVLSKSNLFDEAALVAAFMLFKKAALELLGEGKAVNLLEIGVAYPNAQGGISSANPVITDVPALSLGFTPSQEALKAVSKADVSMMQMEESLPVISSIENLFTHSTDGTLNPGRPARIKGRRLRVAGDADKTGLFLAPKNAEGKIDDTGADWTRLGDENFFKNTSTFLEFILPDSIKEGRYTLVIRTAAGRGRAVNKTVRTLVYEKTLNIA